jgi:hypothetical protein
MNGRSSMSVRAGVALGLVLEAGSAALAADYQAAKDLYDQGQIARARSGFSAVFDDSRQNARDRAAAARGLARINWLIEGNADAASAQLAQALLLKSDECETRTYLVRVLRESGQAAKAVEASGDVSSCTDRPLRDDLLAERAHADLALRNPDAAERSLGQISALGALAPPVNALKVEARLLRGDGAGALQAWRDYYWLTSSDAPPAFAKEPVRAIFHAGGNKGATAHNQCRLLDLLARAGFDEAARTFQEDRGLVRRSAREPLCHKAAIYLEFRSSLSAYLLTQNRKMAWMSVSDKAAMQKIADDMGEYLTTLVQQTAAKLQQVEPQPKGDGPVGIVTDEFNLGSTFGFTSGYPSVHLGHVVLDETRKVEQYGRSAELNFRVYDPMISNGFQSWLWDGEKQTGGWGSTGTIVQIRAPYALSTIRWTAVATDPATRRKAETDAREHSAGDLALLAQAQASGKKVVYLPGLADRLELQSIDQIRSSLGRLSPDDIPRRFAERESELTTRHSIWIHEGRHVLDGKYLKDRNFSQGELEYRAKLAEILLAEYPRMAFGSINDSLVNSDSSHGEANTRIMTAYADWIATHANEVRGFEASAPALTQVDKLTDEQLRTVAAGLADFREGAR